MTQNFSDISATVTVPASVAIGHLVYLTGPNAADKASNAHESTASAVGVVVHKLHATRATIALVGELSVFQNLRPGATYYLGTDGGLALLSEVPTTEGSVAQRVGVASNPTTLYFIPGATSRADVRGGAVSSVFGRVGAVTSGAGDYAFEQIGGALSDAQHAALGGGTLHREATTLDAGFMSGSDKAKLDAIEPGAEVNTVASVFGRTGAVTAQPGDYGASDVGAIALAEKGAALGVATLDTGGKVPSAQLPAFAIADAFPVSSEAAMLALDADRGDLAIRSDLSKTFVLAAEPATSLANWLELLTPTDAVLSVAGRTGAITLSRADIADLGNVSNDAQLKRSAGDFASFPHKPDPIGADVVLLENAAGGDKRSTTIAAALRGAASASIWLPDAAPLAPHPLDYEGGSDISGFAEWDHGSLLTLSAVDGYLRMAHVGGTLRLAGAYKALPSSEIAFYAKISVITRLGPHTRIGVFVAEDATDSAKRAEVLFAQVGGPPSNEWFQHSMANYETFQTNRGGLNSRSSSVYCRGRINGSSCAFDMSDDGVSWIQIPAVPLDLGYVPLHFGVCMNNEPSGQAVALVRFLRVFEGAGCSGIEATRIGRVVHLGV